MSARNTSPTAVIDPLADPSEVFEGVPLTSYRLPSWFIWAVLGGVSSGRSASRWGGRRWP